MWKMETFFFVGYRLIIFFFGKKNLSNEVCFFAYGLKEATKIG